MTKNHYNNVIAWTLKNDPAAKTEDTLAGARAIFKNMGVALPNGNMEAVASILATNDYMGWRACSAEEAQAAADRGTAAIAVTEDSIHILPAADDTLNSDAAVIHAVDEAAAYYTYSCGTTTEEPPMPIEPPFVDPNPEPDPPEETKTWAEYAEDLISVAQSKLGKTYAELENEYSDFSGHPDAWCVDFVCLCCDLAGLSSANGQIIVPDESSSLDMCTWFSDRGMYSENMDSIQRGDILFTYKPLISEDLAHTCIALSSKFYDSKEKAYFVNAIHGNWPNRVATQAIRVAEDTTQTESYHVIRGYARPNYELTNNA